MVVFALDVAPTPVRGELTRWFLEIKPGVFVGNVNARIRQLLWKRIIQDSDCKGAVMLYSMNTEQGFAAEAHGVPRRTVIDMEGVQLICYAPEDHADINQSQEETKTDAAEFSQQLARITLEEQNNDE